MPFSAAVVVLPADNQVLIVNYRLLKNDGIRLYVTFRPFSTTVIIC